MIDSGVGPICALVSRRPWVSRSDFASSTKVGSYLGLSPRLHQSGLTMRMGRISKMGHPATRTLLVQASIQFMRCSPKDCELYAWATSIEKRRGRGPSQGSARPKARNHYAGDVEERRALRTEDAQCGSLRASPDRWDLVTSPCLLEGAMTVEAHLQ